MDGSDASALGLDRPAERVLADNIVGGAAERATLRHADLDVSTQVLADDPEAVLLREGHDASAVVVGSYGRGAFTGLLLGSVGLAVADRAQCPVIVVLGDKAGLVIHSPKKTLFCG
ncbi:universal stress protein [Streptomyces platensis]|uniref:universal stress protein n=1 Tax=Streptomyces platensis TaxID=58346 RepID=UPI00386417E9|nr:universal stress protein [Streptomyces platensis]